MDIKYILKLETDKKIEGTYIIDNMKKVPFKDEAKGNYLTFKLFDKTGIIDAKMWKDCDEIFDKIKNGDVVIIIGASDNFNNKISVVVMKIEVDHKCDVIKFLPTSPFNPETMYAGVCDILDKIKDKDILKLWKEIENDEIFIEKFKKCPGGKGKTHHAYIHGLLEHTYSMLNILEKFASVYVINSDKLYMGAFLHDAGKVYTYKYDRNIDMTNLGRLHEHTALGYSFFMIKMLDIEVEKEKRMEIIEDIGHIILSHHDTPEFHTFVRPMTLEAKLVAQADYLDSFKTRFERNIEETDDEWVFDTLEKQFYFKR